jgi:hypothetical protein
MNKHVTQAEEPIFNRIYVIRGCKVILDADLARLYGVETKVLKQAVKRNPERFPEDFMYELTSEEWEIFKYEKNTNKNLRSQLVTSSWGGSRYPPMAFTEQGVAMLSSVLRSQRAVDVNIQIMRVFVKMRLMINAYDDLLKKIEKLESADSEQNKHIKNIYNLIKELIEPAVKEKRPIGFKTGKAS